MENEAFAHYEHLLHFPQYFQNYNKNILFLTGDSLLSLDPFIWNESIKSIVGKGL